MINDMIYCSTNKNIFQTLCHEFNTKHVKTSMSDTIDEKLTLPISDEEVTPVVDEPTITSAESHTEVHAAVSSTAVNNARSATDEIAEVTIPDDSGVNLLGSSSQSGAVRNYEIYNRMDGCSSDEETQTDNDDGNSLDDGTEILPEHHYVVLHDEMFEFGEFTSADISNDRSNNDCIESLESLSGTPIVPHVLDSKNKDHLDANFIEAIDSTANESDSAVLPPPAVEVAYVSIPPLSAGNDVTNTSCQWSNKRHSAFFMH